MSYFSNESDVNLIDKLLADQQSLTTVEKFSQRHERDTIPAQQRYYKDLIPHTSPGKEEQYAFEVDLDACTGCKACVTACHSLNGLDTHESWRDVGTLFGGSPSQPKQQTVTTACHHCADPGCLNGCPVLAYEKDQETGIVRHLDDQCIGCQYCILKCPYDVPKYIPRLGIVRKCDMCIGRLKEGEAPACVQACPTKAISIRLVKTTPSFSLTDSMLPGAFPSAYTQPTTRFKGAEKLPGNMTPGDREDLTPEHNHLPLVYMLVGTQASIGIMTAAFLFDSSPNSHWFTLAGFLIGLTGMISSFTHLGSPLGAWRSFLGLRKSWLSREIVTLGTWFPLAGVHVLTRFIEPLAHLSTITAYSAAVMGIIGILCSIMVYVDTHRDFWNFPQSASRFLGTTCISSLIAAAFLGSQIASVIASLLILTKLAIEASSLLPANQTENPYTRKTARLQLIPLRPILLTRMTLGILTAICILLPLPTIIPLLCAITFLAGELLERTLFFRAVAAPRMPGIITSQPIKA